MTEQQQTLCIRILRHGFATGATHRYECLQVYIRAYPAQKEAAIAACAAFERGCAFSPEGAMKLEQMSDADFYSYVAAFSAKRAA